jgi:branched-subunit amino acid aminotransferase/4-amino-4-deoxychorismate lyase
MPDVLNKAMVNGNLVPLSEARVSLTHPVFLTSFGVYESIQVDRGRPFHLHDHFERLYNSASLLQMALPQPLDTLVEWGRRLIATLPPVSYALQVLVLGQDTAEAELVIAFLPRPMPHYPAHLYTGGARVITYQGRREIPQCKSMNTLVNHLARTAARAQGALEALLTHDNRLTEGARSNLFVVHAQSRQVLTPLTETVLSGVTREIAINLMKAIPYPVREAEIFVDTPMAEMFITSTSMHIMPITALNGLTIGDGTVGPVTQEAIARFEAYYENYFVTEFPGSYAPTSGGRARSRL